MRSVLDVVLLALQIYVWILIVSAVLSWLIAFNVINTRNQFVATVWDMIYRMTEPVLRPSRERLPNLGGIDNTGNIRNGPFKCCQPCTE